MAAIRTGAVTGITLARLRFRYRRDPRCAGDRTMWIPYRLYEALPKIYVAAGGLVLAGALYAGFVSRSVLVYLLVALACVGYGASITWLRYRYRRPRPVVASVDGDNTIIAMARRFH
jgi:hypothetical protein